MNPIGIIGGIVGGIVGGIIGGQGGAVIGAGIGGIIGNTVGNLLGSAGDSDSSDDSSGNSVDTIIDFFSDLFDNDDDDKDKDWDRLRNPPGLPPGNSLDVGLDYEQNTLYQPSDQETNAYSPSINPFFELLINYDDVTNNPTYEYYNNQITGIESDTPNTGLGFNVHSSWLNVVTACPEPVQPTLFFLAGEGFTPTTPSIDTFLQAECGISVDWDEANQLTAQEYYTTFLQASAPTQQISDPGVIIQDEAQNEAGGEVVSSTQMGGQAGDNPLDRLLMLLLVAAATIAQLIRNIPVSDWIDEIVSRFPGTTMFPQQSASADLPRDQDPVKIPPDTRPTFVPPPPTGTTLLPEERGSNLLLTEWGQTADGTRRRIKKLTPQQVKNLGIHQDKGRGGNRGTDEIWIDNDGKLYVHRPGARAENGDLIVEEF